jgi:hypothetical protein
MRAATCVHMDSIYAAIVQIQSYTDCVSTTTNYHTDLTGSLAIGDLGMDKGTGTLRPSWLLSV